MKPYILMTFIWALLCGLSYGQVFSEAQKQNFSENILSNPGAESGLASWTNSAGTLSLESTTVFKGQKAFKISLSSQTLSFYQDSTKYQAQYADLIQGQASVRVKTSVSGIYVCPRQAGNTILTNCAPVDSSGKWGSYKIPFILGGTSNGVAVVSGTYSNGLVTLGSVTGDVYVDDGGLIADAAFTDASKATLTGSITNPTTCTLTTTSSSAASFSSCSPTILGSATALSGGRAGLNIPAGSQPGYYIVTSTATAVDSQATAGLCHYFLYVNGVNVSTGSFGMPTNNDPTGTYAVRATYNATGVVGTAVELEVKGARTVDATCTFTLQDFDVLYIPTSRADAYTTQNIFAPRAGQVISVATPTCPSGSILADGSNISRSTYYQLFNAIGTTHGTGDGSSTFGLPDYRWVSLRGTGSAISVTGSGSASSSNATFTSHGVNRTGTRVRLSSGTLSGLSTSTDYYAIVVDANTLAFATSYANALAGTKIAISGANSGVIIQWEDPDISTRLAAGVGGNSTGVGTRQDDQLKSHSHVLDMSQVTSTAATKVMAGTSTAASGSYSTQATGGNQTNDRNVSVTYCILTEDANLITGVFKEVSYTPGLTKSINFGFRSSAACSTGNCAGTFKGTTLSAGNTVFTSTGFYTTTIPTGKCSATPFCEVGLVPFSSNSNKCNQNSSSSTSLTVVCTNSAGSVVNEGFAFDCTCEAP
jgi:microcystin-dependent protein